MKILFTALVLATVVSYTTANAQVFNWVYCADERGVCSFSGTAEVRYGANGQWNTLTATDGIGCSNSVFGDPIVGVVKTCEVNTQVAQVSNWQYCADEREVCSFSGTAEVRYGANDQWNTLTATDEIGCNNSVFGDPIVGVAKTCEVNAQVLNWSYCADEGEVCSFSGTSEVRYGADGQWYTLTSTDQIECNNTVFGDPIVGIEKTCEVPTGSSGSSGPPPGDTPVSGGTPVTFLPPGVAGVGYYCDLQANDYCIDNELITTIIGDQTITVTYVFATNVAIGYHADGMSPWVAPINGNDVQITNITTDGFDIGVQENPDDTDNQGILDANNGWGTYDSTLDITKSLPYFPSGDVSSLVGGIQKNESSHGGCGTRATIGKCLGAYHFLTVYGGLPPENYGKDLIRPHSTGDFKTLSALSDFDFSRLPSDSRFDGTNFDLSEVVQTWLHSSEIMKAVNNGEAHRAFRGEYLVDDYGSGKTQEWFNHMALMVSDDLTLSQKMPSLAAMLAHGQDQYYAFFDPALSYTASGSGAGQGAGVANPAFFFAALHSDSVFLDRVSQVSSTPEGGGNVPSEISQIRVTANSPEPVWGDVPPQGGVVEQTYWWVGYRANGCYPGSTKPCVSVGNRTRRDPHGYIDGPEQEPGAAYMGVTGGPYKAIAVFNELMPSMCQAYNYPPLQSYAKRVQNIGIQALPDPCRPVDPRDDNGSNACDLWPIGTGCDHYGLQNGGFTVGQEITWGPRPFDRTKCVGENSYTFNGGDWQDEANWTENNGSSHPTPVGRYPSFHNQPITFRYEAAQWEANFASIMAGNSCPGVSTDPAL